MAQYIVRYGAMRLMGVFDPPQNQIFVRDTRVIVRTSRGLEAGTLLCDATEPALASLKEPDHGQILRVMNHEDDLEIKRIHEQERDEQQRCESIIQRLGLEMDLVMIEHIFGGERIVVYYLADGRVDFRELVKMLASEFQTRIEMRQIGVRDEAKLMADYGDCGKPVCCNNHLIQMPPVSMKMAKMQKATLDPTKISGRCGRLKCCLRFEYDTYQEIADMLPHYGTLVSSIEGNGRVVGHELLAESVYVETEDGTVKCMKVRDIEVLPADQQPRRRRSPRSDDRDANRDEDRSASRDSESRPQRRTSRNNRGDSQPSDESKRRPAREAESSRPTETATEQSQSKSRISEPGAPKPEVPRSDSSTPGDAGSDKPERVNGTPDSKPKPQDLDESPSAAPASDADVNPSKPEEESGEKRRHGRRSRRNR